MNLDPVDAAELAQTLAFIADWLRGDQATLDASLAKFVGNPGYDISHLRADLDRFAFLLDGTNTRILETDT